METLTSRQAAARLDVNIQKFHRIARAAGLTAVFEVTPGRGGAKFWAVDDIETLATKLETEGNAA